VPPPSRKLAEKILHPLFENEDFWSGVRAGSVSQRRVPATRSRGIQTAPYHNSQPVGVWDRSCLGWWFRAHLRGRVPQLSPQIIAS
jgi:hypothetical protein